MKVDDDGRIVQFAEKPTGAALDAMAVDTTQLGLPPSEAKARPFIASMGIYVFKKGVLTQLLQDKRFNDFGGEIIPQVRVFLGGVGCCCVRACVCAWVGVRCARVSPPASATPDTKHTTTNAHTPKKTPTPPTTPTTGGQGPQRQGVPL